MFWRTLRERIWQVVWGVPWPGTRYAAVLLIVLLTLLMILGHALELNIAPLVVLACFLAVALLTGGLVVLALAHSSGRGAR